MKRFIALADLEPERGSGEARGPSFLFRYDRGPLDQEKLSWRPATLILRARLSQTAPPPPPHLLDDLNPLIYSSPFCSCYTISTTSSPGLFSLGKSALGTRLQYPVACSTSRGSQLQKGALILKFLFLQKAF